MDTDPSTTVERMNPAESGWFAGYASLFNVLDLGRDRVMAGAFHNSLNVRPAHLIAMLFQHDSRQLVGAWHRIREDRMGLWVEGQLDLGLEAGRRLHRQLKSRRLSGLSIGFRPRRTSINPFSAVRRLHEIDLWEISLVRDPMLPQARVHQVKSIGNITQPIDREGKEFSCRHIRTG